VLLKITHAPFVAVIWSLESLGDYLGKDDDGRSSGVPSLGAPASSMLFRQSGLKASKSNPRALVPAALNQASVVGATRASKSATAILPRPAAAVSNEVNEDLRSLVMKLTSKVEELTAMVAGQETDQQPSDQGAE
jgi:hypothetical protein